MLAVLRWFLCFFVVLIQVGAFLDQSFLTAISGLIFSLFLTINPVVVKEKINIPYWLVFTLFLVLFLAGSILDIRHGH